MFHPQGPTFLELAKQALSSTERGYDLLAPKFDYTPFRTPDDLLTAVVSQLGDDPIGSALDICCGTGAAMTHLRPTCRDSVVGLDMSRGMLAICRNRSPDMPGAARLLLVRGDALAMPFESRFDLAVCFGALGHILPADQPRFVDQVARALRPGGRFVFISSRMPSPVSASFWMSRAFNAAMHLRNALVSPPFIMYYLRFLLPETRRLLEAGGFSVEVREGAFGDRWQRLALVVATKL